jgi:hypothetical protein
MSVTYIISYSLKDVQQKTSNAESSTNVSQIIAKVLKDENFGYKLDYFCFDGLCEKKKITAQQNQVSNISEVLLSNFFSNKDKMRTVGNLLTVSPCGIGNSWTISPKHVMRIVSFYILLTSVRIYFHYAVSHRIGNKQVLVV